MLAFAAAAAAVALPFAAQRLRPTSAPLSTQSEAPRLRRVLVSNDDGIDAPGLGILVQTLLASGQYEVRVVAPAENQSGRSHSITFLAPLEAREVTMEQFATVKAYMVAGTPADCVKVGLRVFCAGWEPDVVLSGINLGGNHGINCVYSGTVAAAREGAIGGIPGIALSVGGLVHTNITDAQYAAAAEVTLKLLDTLWAHIRESCGAQVADTTARLLHMSPLLLNINFPALPPGRAFRGLQVCTNNRSLYNDSYKDVTAQSERTAGGVRKLMLVGNLLSPADPQDLTDDYNAIAGGWIAVTPLSVFSTFSESEAPYLRPLTTLL